ncbi:MAG: PPOX class F420-dependent oxidoreductase [Acidobacteriota bacterium]
MSDDRLKAFANENYLNLMTFKKDGTGVPTPVWFAERQGTIYVYTLAESWKVKRVRHNPKVRLAPCDMRGNLKGEWLDAEARIVTGDEEQLGHQLLDKKYGWMKKIGNLFSRLRKRQRTVMAINLV